MTIRPMTLDRAVQVAMDKQNLRHRFELRTRFSQPQVGTRPQNQMSRRGEPMEVDQACTRNCYRCGRAGFQARNCRVVEAVQEARTGPPRTLIQCWSCGKRGHTQRECRRPRQRGKTDRRAGRQAENSRVLRPIKPRRRTEARVVGSCLVLAWPTFKIGNQRFLESNRYRGRSLSD